MTSKRLVLVLIIALGGCGKKDSPTAPCTDCVTPVQPPSIVCPASIQVTTPSSSVTTAAVEYQAPRTSNGTPPVATVCTMASNATFSAGTTTVSCTSTDAVGRSAVCSFEVAVAVPAPPVPQVQFTRFLAFGDSITAGDNGCNRAGDPCPDANPSFIDVGFEYPRYLEQLMNVRYALQTVTVRNAGVNGESAYTGARYRIDGTLDGTNPRPEVVLILEGANDLGDDRLTVDDVVESLRLQIRSVKGRGMKAMISTLTPIYVPNCIPAYPCRNGAAPFIGPANDRIKSLAASEGAILVDGFAALSQNLPANIGYDGLHPTRAGRQALAQAFLNAIQANFEAMPSATRRRIR